MSILVYWKYENYIADTDGATRFSFSYNSNQSRLHEITEIGEDLFAVTGVKTESGFEYFLIAHLIISDKYFNPADFKYGEYGVGAYSMRAKYFPAGGKPINSLLATLDATGHLPASEPHKYAQALQTIRKLNEHDASSLKEFSNKLPAYRTTPRGRIFGEISGYPEGSIFESRIELSRSLLHRPSQAGISGSAEEGADSIVLSGGYEDDQDNGEEIIYTGHGGRDPNSGRQVADQTLTAQNLALAKNKSLGLPVRVIRGGKHKSPYSPPAGYRYDGLYLVDDYWQEQGQSGFRVWRYRLVKVQNEKMPGRTEPEGSDREAGSPARRETTILRVVRDTKKAKEIKVLYDYTCQVCGVKLEGSAGPYAEAAHIRPLGTPHNGPDSKDNILCLCPNHHVLFDLGGIAIDDDFSLIGMSGRLSVHREHRINPEHLRYHREHYFLSS